MKTGLSAKLGGLLHVAAPFFRARLALLTLLSLSAAFALTATPALAVPPEPPEALKPEPIKATEATLQGILNPKISAATEPGTYQFEYKATKTATKTECESAGASKAPASPGVYFGLAPEPENEPVSPLTEGTEYIVCLAATNAGGTTVSPPFPFKTGLKLETAVNAKVKAGSITATSAQVEGELNPGKERKTDQGSFEVIYKLSALSAPPTGECEESATSAQSTSGAKEEQVSATLENLQPNAKYTFCLRVHNEDGEEATGAPVTFTTKAIPPTIVSESTSNVKAEEATLEGVLNPNNQVTECHFQYGLASGTVSEHEVPCSPELLKGFGELSVTPMKLNEKGESVPAPITGLEPGQAYRYRIVAKNGKGEESIGPVREFKRLVAPPEKPETDAAETITNTTAVLHGVVNPSSPSSVSWFFRYAAGASCSAAGASTTPAQGPEEVQARSTEAKVTGLQPGAQYTACLVAENEAKEETIGNESSFTTTAVKPTVTEQSISSVNSTEATLGARINAEGTPTTYKVDYGTSEPYASSGEASLPAAESSVGVLAHLTGLTPSSEYHFRFVAHNAEGTAEGTLLAFTTPPSGGPSALTLPDNRVYELVSSPASNQNVYVPEQEKIEATPEDFETGRPVRASADGGAVAYVADPPAGQEGEGGTGNLGNGLGNAWLASRTPQGWTGHDIQPVGTEHATEYLAFSTDLTTGIITSPNQLTVGGAASATGCRLYSRTASDGSLHAFATAAQTTGHCLEGGGEHFPIFAGSSPDGSQLLFEDEAALAPGAVRSAEEQYNLYDSVAGQPESVNVLPSGKTAPDATFGGPAFFTASPIEHNVLPDLSNVIAADGARVFWTDLSTEVATEDPAGTTRLFSREGGRSVQLDASQTPAGEGETERHEREEKGGSGRFWTASPDGSKVFFTDCRKLTAKSTAVFNESTGCAHEEQSEALLIGNDLYEYDFTKPVGERLTDLTVDHHAGDPLRADVQGVVATNETGEPGSYVYFVAGGALAGGATPRTCQAAGGTEREEEEEGELPPTRGCNLYLLHSGEPIKLIAVLSPQDDHLVGLPEEGKKFFGDWRAALNERMAEATPDGRNLVFRSIQSLTGYDNRRKNGQASPEVFVFGAASGRTACASCDPTGAPPTEPGQRAHGGYLPPGGELTVTYMPRWISEDGGRVFFDTPEPLVPQDTNTTHVHEGGPQVVAGVQDVYEWEREGAASCPEKTPARLNGGCVFLLSGGTSTDASYLIDASADGSNVFFASRASLVPEAVNENMKLYDARVGGGFPKASLACTGTGCQGVPPAPAIFATPSSATFNGGGNYPPGPPPKAKTAEQLRLEHLTKALKACRVKKSRHKRVVCEGQARKRYAPPHNAKRSSSAKRASNKRKATR